MNNIEKKIAVIIIIIMGGEFFPPCYSQVTRKEVIDSQLDYYSLKEKADKEKAKIEEIQNKVKEEKRAMSEKAGEERSEKIKKFLKDTAKDIHPNFTVKTTYNDNIYKTHDDNVNAFITTLDTQILYNPSFIGKKGHTSFGIGIQGGPNTNATASRGTFTKGKGTVNASVKHTRGKYTLGVDSLLGKDYSAATELKTGAPISSSFIDYWKRSYGAMFSADWKYLPTTVDYSHDDSLYTKSYIDSNLSEDKVSLTNYFTVFPKTRLLFSYDYERVNYPKRDADGYLYHTFWSGVKGRLSPKLDGTAKFGYKFKNPKSKDIPNTDTQTVYANLDYRMSRRLYHSIEAERNVEATPYAEEVWAKTTTFKLTSNYLPPFSKKLRFALSLYYTNNKYSSDLKNNIYEVGLLAEYALKNHLKISSKYDYVYQDSNEYQNEYKNKVAYLAVTKEF